MEMIVCEECGTVGHTNVQCQTCCNKMSQTNDDVEFLGPEKTDEVMDEIARALERDPSAHLRLRKAINGRTRGNK